MRAVSVMIEQRVIDDEPSGTIERWALDYITATSLQTKLFPADPPDARELTADIAVRVHAKSQAMTPGRPAELRMTEHAKKIRGLRSPMGRARALHTFLHHELQAAELMAWAILAFPNTPAVFRDGLAKITLDEARHMRLYAEQIERLGHKIGEFPARDWFWTRVPTCRDPASFVAVMGLGLESANLEHTATFATRFRDAGDEAGARVQEIVGLEEIAHVRFGVRWFEHFEREELSFERWQRALPSPLTPLLMRGRPLRREARVKAGQPLRFIDELDAWREDPQTKTPTSPIDPDPNPDLELADPLPPGS